MNKGRFEFTPEVDSFKEQFLKWYDSGAGANNFYYLYNQTITQFLLWNYDSIEVMYEEPGRWSQFTTEIIPIKDRFFAVSYDRGLTEMQENDYDFDGNIQEVEKYSVLKKVTSWRDKGWPGK